MTALTVLGVDPGGRATGYVVRRGDELLAHGVITRQHDEYGDVLGVTGVPVGGRYLTAVRVDLAHYACELEVDLVAVEGLTRPTGFSRGRKAPIDPGAVMAAAVTFGAVVGRFPDAVVVRPAGNGSQLLASYPHDLVTPGERRGGLNRPAGQSATIRHARSAWDVAGTAVHVARMQAAVRAAEHA